ncbi:hypothetical protein EOA13_30130 [Mesorhizobium sp. M7A.F.Ca.US.011.01.1.1]|nr:hypothetical protein EOA13_30130 [Mesorhizobium sp. M7A.F.Ca.US.011.01.1.1]
MFAISPVQTGGRSDVTSGFANRQRCRNERSAEAANLPLAGEMSGRTEGGAAPPTSIDWLA